MVEIRWIRSGHEHTRDEASTAARPGDVRESRLQEEGDLPEELSVLRVGEPHGRGAEAEPVSDDVRGAGIEVAIEVGEEAGDEDRERSSVILRAPVSHLAGCDLACQEPQGVGPLDRSADPALGDHLEDPGLGESRNVTIEAPGGHVMELGQKVACRERPVGKERLHDSQPDRVENQIGGGHAPTLRQPFAVVVPFPSVMAMVVIRRFLIGLVASCLLGACAPNPPTSPGATTSNPAAAATGRAFVEAMSRGDWAGAAAMMDPSLAGADAASHLQQTGATMVAMYGPFQSIGGVTTTARGSGTLVGVAVRFASATVTLNVSVNAAGQVVGLHEGEVVTRSAPPAAYVNPGSFTESDVTVGSAPWALPGTLTVPTGPGPFPAVVLVAGSGPQDRNETLGPNKPLRDLAWGLASAGIVVLRYDKRTLVYGPQMAALPSPTVREETTDDAVAAVALLRQIPKVNPARIFLVGHSLGATVAPRIAAEIPGQLAGIGMLEAASTPIADLMLIQVQYLTSLAGSPSPSAAAQIDALRAAVALADSPSLSLSTPASQLPGGVPASYWLDLRTYQPLVVAARLSLPMFLSQGQRDYQVPPSELGPWRQALAGHSNVTVKTYPDMDHLLLDGSGPATPAEYSVPGHVDAQLVADLATWVASD